MSYKWLGKRFIHWRQPLNWSENIKMTKTGVTRFSMQHSTTTWRSHRLRSLTRFLQREFESLTSWKKYVCLPHTSTPDALLVEARTDKHKHPQKLNRTDHNQTTNHINITMCAQAVPLHSDSLLQLFSTSSNTLHWSFLDGHTRQYVCYACCTESYSPYNADSDQSLHVTPGYGTPPPLSSPLPLFSSHLSSAFLSVNLSLPLYHHLSVTLLTGISLWTWSSFNI